MAWELPPPDPETPPPSSPPTARPARLAGLGGRARWAPFGAGAAVALAAVLLYGVLAPGTPPLTAQDVEGQHRERARLGHAAAGLLPVGLPGGRSPRSC